MQAVHMSFMTDSLGPGLPSLEELLACTQAHDILGVDKDANIETIKRAYHKRARAFHPDKHGDDNRDIDRAFNQAFMLITRAYMTLSGGDADKERLQILNKMDLRKDRPVVGWALQQKYDERKRERLTRAEKALVEARKEVAAAQQASLGGPLGTAKDSRALQRRLTKSKLALMKAEATVQAEEELYQIQQQKDREKVMQRLAKEERTKEGGQKQATKKRPRPSGRQQQMPADILDEASRLEAQAEEMRKKAASLRAQAGQNQQVSATSIVPAEDSPGSRAGKRRLLIQ